MIKETEVRMVINQFNKAYYEEKLNHITFAVVQFRFLQAIDKDDFEI